MVGTDDGDAGTSVEIGQHLSAGPGGPAGVGSGWTSTTAWLVAGAVLALLVLVTWWIAAPGRRQGKWRGRGAELALRRYELRSPRRGRSTGPELEGRGSGPDEPGLWQSRME